MSTGPSSLFPALSYTPKTRLIISTTWVGPTSMFGSGGLTRKPKMSKLSWLLSPSNELGAGIAAGAEPVWSAASVLCELSPTGPPGRWRGLATSSNPVRLIGVMSRSGFDTSKATAVLNRGLSGGAALATAAKTPNAANTATVVTVTRNFLNFFPSFPR